MSVTLGLSAVSSVVFCFLSCPLVALVVPSLSPSLLELLASSKRFTCAIHQLTTDTCFQGKHRCTVPRQRYSQLLVKSRVSGDPVEQFKRSDVTKSSFISGETNRGAAWNSLDDQRLVLRIQDVYPGSEYFHPGSWVKKIPDPESGSASKNLCVFKPKNWF